MGSWDEPSAREPLAGRPPPGPSHTRTPRVAPPTIPPPPCRARSSITTRMAHLRGGRGSSSANASCPWLPISEPAFLLWVLVVLMAVWVVIGLVLLT